VPFNLLLMPLIAGYLFLAKTHLFAYATSLLEKEQLLLRASIAGLIFAICSRLCCCALAQTSYGLLGASALWHLAPFPFIGTALGALVISLLFRWIVNFLVPLNVAGDWLYQSGQLNQLESLLLRSAMGVPSAFAVSKLQLISVQSREMFGAIFSLGPRWLDRIKEARFDSPFGYADPEPVMLTMKDGKVYVGFISQLPPVTGKDFLYFRLTPIWSGYRDDKTKEVVQVTSYAKAIERSDDLSRLVKVLACTDVANANLFEEKLFDIPDADTIGTKLRSMRSATRPRRTKKKIG